jgi:hypothetical protein
LAYFHPVQQKKIQQWLFDDHLSYRKTHELMKTDLGITCSPSAIAPLYHYLAELRADNVVLNAQNLAVQMSNSGIDVEKLCSASRMLIASQFLQKVTHGASIPEIVALGRLMLQSDTRNIQMNRPSNCELPTEITPERHLPVRHKSDKCRQMPTKKQDKPALNSLVQDKSPNTPV